MLVVMDIQLLLVVHSVSRCPLSAASPILQSRSILDLWQEITQLIDFMLIEQPIQSYSTLFLRCPVNYLKLLSNSTFEALIISLSIAFVGSEFLKPNRRPGTAVLTMGWASSLLSVDLCVNYWYNWETCSAYFGEQLNINHIVAGVDWREYQYLPFMWL